MIASLPIVTGLTLRPGSPKLLSEIPNNFSSPLHCGLDLVTCLQRTRYEKGKTVTVCRRNPPPRHHLDPVIKVPTTVITSVDTTWHQYHAARRTRHLCLIFSKVYGCNLIRQMHTEGLSSNLTSASSKPFRA